MCDAIPVARDAIRVACDGSNLHLSGTVIAIKVCNFRALALLEEISLACILDLTHTVCSVPLSCFNGIQIEITLHIHTNNNYK